MLERDPCLKLAQVPPIGLGPVTIGVRLNASAADQNDRAGRRCSETVPQPLHRAVVVLVRLGECGHSRITGEAYDLLLAP